MGGALLAEGNALRSFRHLARTPDGYRVTILLGGEERMYEHEEAAILRWYADFTDQATTIPDPTAPARPADNRPYRAGA